MERINLSVLSGASHDGMLQLKSYVDKAVNIFFDLLDCSCQITHRNIVVTIRRLLREQLDAWLFDLKNIDVPVCINQEKIRALVVPVNPFYDNLTNSGNIFWIKQPQKSMYLFLQTFSLTPCSLFKSSTRSYRILLNCRNSMAAFS